MEVRPCPVSFPIGITSPFSGILYWTILGVDIRLAVGINYANTSSSFVANLKKSGDVTCTGRGPGARWRVAPGMRGSTPK